MVVRCFGEIRGVECVRTGRNADPRGSIVYFEKDQGRGAGEGWPKVCTGGYCAFGLGPRDGERLLIAPGEKGADLAGLIGTSAEILWRW